MTEALQPGVLEEEPTSLSVLQLGAAYRREELAPTQVLEAYLRRVEVGTIYRTVMVDRAWQQAERAEALFKQGVDTGPLQGVPIALKDHMDTRGEVSAAGSHVLLQALPAAEDCLAAARLDTAGAVFLGRTNMSELALSGTGINPHFGTPGCAADRTRIPGGSSSGSAVAVALHQACAAIGSDTGGSIRIPASFNRLVGLKVTNGSILVCGCVPLSPTLDTLGPIARTPHDARALFHSLRGRLPPPLPGASRHLKLLVPTTVLIDGLDPPVKSAFEEELRRIEGTGHAVERREVPPVKKLIEAQEALGSIALFEAASLHGELVRRHQLEMDSMVAMRILSYRKRSSEDYARLMALRERYARAFWQIARRYDAILSPTVPIEPPKIRFLQAGSEAGERMQQRISRNTNVFNLLGGPAVTVPIDCPAGKLPVGLTVATPPGMDDEALAFADRLVSNNIHPA